MPHTSTGVVTVTDATFDTLVLAASSPVVVDFWAPWCPPCRMISLGLADLAEEFAGRVVVATVNADDNPVVTRRYGVMAMPTLLYVRDGQVVNSVVGARPKAFLRQTMTDLTA